MAADVSVYRAKLAGEDVVFTDSINGTGCTNSVVSTMERCKGAADTFGLMQRIGQFATPLVPESMTDWTSTVSAGFGKARTALAIPYSINLIGKLSQKFDTRNALDLTSSGFFAGSLMTLDQAASATLSGLGSTFKTMVDSLDLKNSIEKYVKCKDQLDEAEKDPFVSEQVESGLKNQLWVNALKIGRFVFAVFSGILTMLKFIFSVTLAKELLIAGLVSGVVSLGFSFAAELVGGGASIVPAPKAWAIA